MQDDVAADLAANKVQLQPPTDGSGGRPLLLVRASRHRPGSSPDHLRRFIFFGLELASRCCWDARNADGKMAALIDLAGLQMKHLDAQGLLAAFSMLNGHFPERVASIWMVESPALFHGLWRVVEPFIDP